MHKHRLLPVQGGPLLPQPPQGPELLLANQPGSLTCSRPHEGPRAVGPASGLSGARLPASGPSVSSRPCNAEFILDFQGQLFPGRRGDFSPGPSSLLFFFSFLF